MLYATRMLSVVFFAFVMFANVDQLQAATYELGPFQVTGMGINPDDAADDAYGQAWDIMAGLSETLPEGDEIIEFVVEYEGYILPTVFVLEFHVVVQEGGTGGYHINKPGW